MAEAQRAAGLAGWAAALTLMALAAPRGAAAQSPCRNVAIRSPVTGEVVTGTVPVLGSAQIDGFQFYKVEWAPADAAEVWGAVSDVHREAVINGLLDQWNTAQVPDGVYRLKLTVVDQAAVEVCRALVEDVVVGAPATPTETATATATATATEAVAVPTAIPPEGASATPGAEAALAATATLTATLAAVAPEASGPPTATTSVTMGGLMKRFTLGFGLAFLIAAAIVLLFGRRGGR
jgi:hypothetical protein